VLARKFSHFPRENNRGGILSISEKLKQFWMPHNKAINPTIIVINYLAVTSPPLAPQQAFDSRPEAAFIRS
jgi:hypothetical protein